MILSLSHSTVKTISAHNRWESVENMMEIIPRPNKTKKLVLFVRLVLICLVLITIQHFTSHQVRLNSAQGISFNIKRSLAEPTLTNDDVDSSRLSSSNQWKEEQNLTAGLSKSSSDKFHGNITTRSPHWCDRCINYHQYKVLIYPKYIPDTYLGMVMFIPSQHGDSSFQRRQFLRKFPLNSKYFPQIKMRHLFVFGKCNIYILLYLFIYLFVCLFICLYLISSTNNFCVLFL